MTCILWVYADIYVLHSECAMFSMSYQMIKLVPWSDMLWEGPPTGPYTTVALGYRTNPGVNVIRHNAKTQCCLPQCADDKNLSIEFDPTVPGDLPKANSELTECFQDARTWMLTNSLQFKDGKTEYMCVMSHHLPTNGQEAVTLGGFALAPVNTIITRCTLQCALLQKPRCLVLWKYVTIPSSPNGKSVKEYHCQYLSHGCPATHYFMPELLQCPVGQTAKQAGAETRCRTKHQLIMHAPRMVATTPSPCCELRIGRVSESNRCNTVRKGLWERTTLGRWYFFPANFVTLLAVIWLDGEHYFSAGTYTPNNIKL